VRRTSNNWPNSKGGPRADNERYAPPSWYAEGEIMHAAYTAHADDDDWSQPGVLSCSTA
jgi:catalase